MALNLENYDPALKYGAVVVANDVGTDAVDGDNIADDSINSEHYAAASIDQEHMANDSVAADELDYETATVTVGTIAVSGTAACTASSIILGIYPDATAAFATGNAREVTGLAESSGVVTVTVATGTAAASRYVVTLLKASS